MTFIGLFLLVGILLLCLLGLLHPRYNDNLGHCVGMIVIGLWAFAQVLRVASVHYMPIDDIWLCAGLMSFGLGTAVRTWLYKRNKR